MKKDTEKYLYGVTRYTGEHLAVSFEDEEIDRCYQVFHQDLGLVISDTKRIDLAEVPKEQLAHFLIRHQRTIEKVMEGGYSILPMKLGTFAVDEEEVKNILKQGYDLMKGLINKLGGRVEIDLAATWADFPDLLKKISQRKEILDFKAAILKKPEGVTHDDQVKIGTLVRNIVNEEKSFYDTTILEHLSFLSDEKKKHELMDESMVFNMAFLLERNKIDEFVSRVTELNTRLEEKICFRCIGPLPPYSFYTLEIKRLYYEEINWARRKLGLPEGPSSKMEMKKAFQKAAFAFHPDHHPNSSQTEKEFIEASRAYNLLKDYVQAVEQRGPQGSLCQDNPKMAYSMLIKVKD